VAVLSERQLPVEVVQFGDNFLSWRNRPPLLHRVAVIRHSPFRFRLEDTDPATVATVRRLLNEAGRDPTDPVVWRELSLAMAMHAQPRGPVVCSMFSPKHIARNAQIADGGAFSEALLSAVTEAAA
jgi:hypothetical protein